MMLLSCIRKLQPMIQVALENEKKKKFKKIKEKLICEGYRDMNSYQTHLPKISSSSPTPLKCSVS